MWHILFDEGFKEVYKLLYIHPATQFIATMMAIYALVIGGQRFRFLHLGQKASFKWQRHVWFGGCAVFLWFIGFWGGLFVVKNFWYSVLITGLHAKVGAAMIPLMLFGIITGMYMHKKKKKRKVLPLLHGINNLILLILALFQFYSGWYVYNAFVLGNG